MNKSLRPFLFRIGFLSVMLSAVVVFLGLAELGVRLFWGEQINLQYTSAELYQEKFYSTKTDGWKPGAVGSSCGIPVKINSLGLRGPEIDLNTGKKRILLLGDSVLFGIAVDEEQTIAGNLRERLDTCIINTAVIGYATQHYVDVLRHWLGRAKIDRVLVFFCLNDIHNRTDPVFKPHASTTIAFILAQLRSNSKLYMAMKNMASDRSKVYFEFSHQAYTASDPDFVGAMRDVVTMKSMCEAAQVKLDFVILPFEYQLRNRRQEGIWSPQELMGSFFQQHSIDHLNIDFASTDGDAAKKPYLYADGIHFSALGASGGCGGGWQISCRGLVEKLNRFNGGCLADCQKVVQGFPRMP